MLTGVPQELKELPQWVTWRTNTTGRKVPFSPRTHSLASSTDPDTWGSFDEAISCMKTEAWIAGVGFVFNHSGDYCGIDLDYCFESENVLKPWALQIVDRLDSYTEISPSGQGLHIIVKGKLPPGCRRKGSLEMYDEGRYFTVTGNILFGKVTVNERQKELTQLHEDAFGKEPSEASDRDADVSTGSSLTLGEIKKTLDLALGADNGLKFGRLWNGDTSEYASHSEADVALCSMLAFWVNGDPLKIDQMFRRSSLMRDKWDREDYRQRTLQTALQNIETYYTPRGELLSEGADDEGNAQCAKKLFGDRILFCEAFGWMFYTGKHWNRGTGESATDRAVVETLKRRRAAAINSDGDLEAIIRAARPSAAHVRNCKTLLRSLVLETPRAFDAAPDKLNCQNGVLNLRTGELTPHDHSQRFSNCIPVEYDPNADQSSWCDWLKDVVGGGQQVLDFLQMAVGYSLTGSTREEIMFYVWGPPRGGKGTFTETLMAMLGGEPLAVEIDIGAFTESRNPSNQNFDLAGLKPTRFVAASESKESNWLDGARLKRWTGGNIVRCAHKYHGFFTYRPQFKIWLTSNFQLQIDPDDEAAWTRPQVIEFPNSWVGREDKTLKEKMRQPDVLKGVLAWAVEGAMRWYKLPKGGLRAPASVVAATKRARQDLDWVAKWVEEEVDVTNDSEHALPNDEYYDKYRMWCTERGAPVKKLPSLNRTLSAKGFKIGVPKWHRGKTRRCWIGVLLRTDPAAVAFKKLGKEIENDSLGS